MRTTGVFERYAVLAVQLLFVIAVVLVFLATVNHQAETELPSQPRGAT